MTTLDEMAKEVIKLMIEFKNLEKENEELKEQNKKLKKQNVKLKVKLNNITTSFFG